MTCTFWLSFTNKPKKGTVLAFVAAETKLENMTPQETFTSPQRQIMQKSLPEGHDFKNVMLLKPISEAVS